ncbi:MAG: endonuclease III [Saprospiraceae bacterium]
MTRREKTTSILTVLEKYFPEPKIPLIHKDPFTLLIAVLLSAQCTDERVNKITPLLYGVADDPWKMSKLTVQQIEQIIRPCGLGPAKSKAILNTSILLIDQYQGIVPDRIDLLEQLPGVGHKTASVVICQAFNKPAFPVDTHIQRSAYRWGLSDGTNVVQTETDLKKLIQESQWNKAHLQIILFARKYCPARGHHWMECPICSKYGVKSRM